MNLKQALLFTSALIVSHPLLAIDNKTLDFSPLERQVTATKSLAKLPSGTSVAVVKNDQIIYLANWGYADIEGQVPVTEHTPYYIASITKPFTALNALLDINEQRLSADTPIASMFPNLSLPAKSEQNITLKHLLTHTSGINNMPLVLATAFSGVHSPKTLEQMVLINTSVEPNTIDNFQYTNVGYNIFSVFADKHFDNAWQERLASGIFKPLNMPNTSARMSDYQNKHVNVAKPYSLMASEPTTPLYLEKVDQTMQAAGGMVSTTSDLAKFAIAQLNLGKVEGKQVFPADVIAKSHQQQATTEARYEDFERDGYAWGWYIGQYKNEKMLHHFGGFAGTHAHLSFIPEQKIAVIILNNEDFLSGKLTSLIADYIYGTLLNDPDTVTRVNQRFDSLNNKLSVINKMRAKQQEKIAARQLVLSLPKGAYLGVYQHPTLGDIEVSLTSNKQLALRWGQLSTIATGFDKADKLRVTFIPTSGEILSFNTTNQVDSLTFDGMNFVKKS
ncbi:serine hydrolase domain-containing protein [Thalassotalea ganghwensis]